MQVKRSRIAQTIADAGIRAILDQSSMDPNIGSENQQYGQGILTVSSPEVVKQSGGGGRHDHQGQIGSFLDKCHFCKKRMRQQDEAFMCGSLHAFCTPLCRDKQIVVDKVVDRVAKQPRGTGKECNELNDVMDQSGFQVANCASLQ